MSSIAESSPSYTIGLVFLYFVPMFVAWLRHHHQFGPIAIVNVLLGWTFIGWVVALAMACSAVRPRTTA